MWPGDGAGGYVCVCARVYSRLHVGAYVCVCVISLLLGASLVETELGWQRSRAIVRNTGQL